MFPSKIISIYPCCSHLERRVSVKRFVSLNFLNLKTVGMSPWTGDQPVARPLPTQDNTHTINANSQALSGIRTHDPSGRAGEDISCLRPRGHCDRPFKEYASDINLSLPRPVSITDGAPAVVGSRNGFAGLCRRDESIPCSSHTAQLFTKKLCVQKWSILNV
jgi:hypothetical protein